MNRPAAHAALLAALSAVASVTATVVVTPAQAQPRADGTERGPRAPVPLDGVAAVVDDAVIYRSDVAARSRPFLDRLSKNPVERRAMLVELEKQLLSTMIDELLIAKDAAAAKISVTDAEVSSGIDSVAAANKIDRTRIEAEVKKQGLTRLEYESMIRQQILEGKWLMARAVSKIDRSKASTTGAFEAELAKHKERLLVDLRRRAFIEVR